MQIRDFDGIYRAHLLTIYWRHTIQIRYWLRRWLHEHYSMCLNLKQTIQVFCFQVFCTSTSSSLQNVWTHPGSYSKLRVFLTDFCITWIDNYNYNACCWTPDEPTFLAYFVRISLIAITIDILVSNTVHYIVRKFAEKNLDFSRLHFCAVWRYALSTNHVASFMCEVQR